MRIHLPHKRTLSTIYLPHKHTPNLFIPANTPSQHRPQVHLSAKHYRGPAVLDPLYPKMQPVLADLPPSQLTSLPNEYQFFGSSPRQLSSLIGTTGSGYSLSNRNTGAHPYPLKRI